MLFLGPPACVPAPHPRQPHPAIITRACVQHHLQSPQHQRPLPAARHFAPGCSPVLPSSASRQPRRRGGRGEQQRTCCRQRTASRSGGGFHPQPRPCTHTHTHNHNLLECRGPHSRCTPAERLPACHQSLLPHCMALTACCCLTCDTVVTLGRPCLMVCLGPGPLPPSLL
jgi:hypothetical protein